MSNLIISVPGQHVGRPVQADDLETVLKTSDGQDTDVRLLNVNKTSWILSRTNGEGSILSQGHNLSTRLCQNGGYVIDGELVRD